MLSTFETNFQRVKDVEQFAIDSIDRGGLHGDGMIGQSELHCQGYAGEGNPPHDIVLGCTVKVTKNGNRRHTFTLNGRRIACHKIELGGGNPSPFLICSWAAVVYTLPPYVRLIKDFYAFVFGS